MLILVALDGRVLIKRIGVLERDDLLTALNPSGDWLLANC
jgi:hypothetical protein